tara:strand:+ start:112 stop:279 length:168 start_codon:yes stop_codon:yes gene_type:complete
MFSLGESKDKVSDFFNISDILFLGNGTLGPNMSRNATDVEIRNPIKIIDKAKTGL